MTNEKDGPEVVKDFQAKVKEATSQPEEVLKPSSIPEPDRKSRQEWPPKKSYVSVSASDIRPRSLQWIWPGHLLRGTQEIMSGTPGLGKSQVQISFIACATTGSPWPDGADGTEPVNVIMLTAEDALDQTVIPRLIAAGADLSRVKILKWIRRDNKNQQFHFAYDLGELEKMVMEIGGVGLITIDPITAYMGGRMDSHKATEVRHQLGPLKDFAEQTGVAISTITHPAKNPGLKAINQYIGSQAFIAAGRIGHLCVEEYKLNEQTGENKPTGRILFTNPKNNCHIEMPTLIYHTDQTFTGRLDHVKGDAIFAPYVIWDGSCGLSADDAVAAAVPIAPEKVQEHLQKLLRKLLMKGPVEASVIRDQTKAFTKDQLRWAKQQLGITTYLVGFGRDGKWMWRL